VKYGPTQLRKWWLRESKRAIAKLLADDQLTITYDIENLTFVLSVNSPDYIDTLYAQLTQDN
jgi:hypothetical protein